MNCAVVSPPGLVNRCYYFPATGRTFNALHDYVPQAISAFGRGISSTTVVVDEFNYHPWPESYDPNTDIIKLFATSLVNIHEGSIQDVLHEFGHAYQWKAIEHWVPYQVTDLLPARRWTGYSAEWCRSTRLLSRA